MILDQMMPNAIIHSIPCMSLALQKHLLFLQKVTLLTDMAVSIAHTQRMLWTHISTQQWVS